MMTALTPHSLLTLIVTTIKSKAENKKLFIVGITGLDASGKSKIAQAITENLKEQNINVISLSGDSFQFPREFKEKFAEKTWAIQHIKRTINFNSMVKDFLLPLQSHPNSISLNILNYDTGEKSKQIINLHYPLIVVLESIYLFQEEIVKFLDYKIFLEIETRVALERAKSRPRDLMLYGDEKGIEKKYTTKNFSGHSLFDETVQPKQYADIVIDNNDWRKPIIK